MTEQVTEQAAAGPPLEAVQRQVRRLGSVLDAHAGGLQLVGVEDGGSVTVRFTGMCCGCPLRPVSMAGLVRPALLSVEGVTAVSAEGGRISAEAESRLVRQLQAFGSACLLSAVDGSGFQGSGPPGEPSQASS
jgi:Fe-S cluster biogenesis protein NfuA